MAKKKQQECPPGAPAWIVTFSDLMSLLLTFFVLLVSFANFESQKIKEAIMSLKGALGVARPSVYTLTEPNPPFKRPATRKPKEGSEEDQKEKKRREIQAQLSKKGLDRTIGSFVTKEGVVLVALAPVFFEPGRAEFREDSYETLSLIGDVVALYENEVRVEGHTSDATLEAGSPYPTLWELSGARAAAIVRFLAEDYGIDPKRLSFTGFGSARPGVPGKGMQSRWLNDRVEIKLLSSESQQDVGRYLHQSHEEAPDDTEIGPSDTGGP